MIEKLDPKSRLKYFPKWKFLKIKTRRYLLRQIYQDKMEKRNNYERIEMNMTEKEIDNMPINVLDKVFPIGPMDSAF